MNSHDLARELLALPDTQLTVSIDTSTEQYPFRRVFGNSLHTVQPEYVGSSKDDSVYEVVLMFGEGYDNEDMEYEVDVESPLQHSLQQLSSLEPNDIQDGVFDVHLETEVADTGYSVDVTQLAEDALKEIILCKHKLSVAMMTITRLNLTIQNIMERADESNRCTIS